MRVIRGCGLDPDSIAYGRNEDRRDREENEAHTAVIQALPAAAASSVDASIEVLLDEAFSCAESSSGIDILEYISVADVTVDALLAIRDVCQARLVKLGHAQ